MTRLCRISEFAALTGVTVRALHHYDRIGLLCPERAASGYRLYGHRELERLEQIVALRLIGVPLREMGRLLDSSDFAEVLPRQRALLEEKRRLLDEAIRAIATAEQSLASGEPAGTAVLIKIIEVIEMQNKDNWTDKYYSPEAQEALKKYKASFTPEMQAKAQQDWRDLFRDVEAALDQDPASESAQALGRRWKALLGSFTQGNPAIAEGLNRVYADRSNWPEDARQQMTGFSDPRVWQFMGRVLNCTQLSK